MKMFKKCLSRFASFVWWFYAKAVLFFNLFFASNFSSSGHLGPAGSLLASGEQKNLALDVTYSSATHADQAHDVTGMGNMALLMALRNFHR